jgi:hypothetical protein
MNDQDEHQHDALLLKKNLHQNLTHSLVYVWWWGFSFLVMAPALPRVTCEQQPL